MNPNELNELSDQELLAEVRKLKSYTITNAFFIGFLIGIVIYSIIAGNFGVLMIIPLYLVYRLANHSKAKKSKDLNKLLKERNLK